MASPMACGGLHRQSTSGATMSESVICAVIDTQRRRLIVGIGELAVSSDRESVVITHALGSCVAVCVWDEVAGVAGLVHLLLPHSSINPQRAGAQPAAFADTGIPLLFRTAYQHGLQKGRCQV